MRDALEVAAQDDWRAALIGRLPTRAPATNPRAALAVYMDALLAADDPRGEVIARWLVEERPLPHGDAVAARWLGDAVARLHAVAIGPGVLDVDGDDALAAVYASPGAACVSAVTDATVATLERIAARANPWLVRLALVDGASAGAGRIAPALMDAVLAACPRLAQLEIGQGWAIEDVAGAQVVALATDVAALGALRGDGRASPGVFALRLTEDPITDASMLANARLAPASHFPALASLDVTGLQDAISAYAALAAVVAEHPRLRVLRLPALETVDDADELARALAACDALDEVAVYGGNRGDARTYEHARATLAIPPYRPWAAGSGGRLAAEDRALAVSELLRVLDTVFDRMRPAGRAAWARAWRELDARRAVELSAAELAAMFDGLALLWEPVEIWLAAARARGTITLRRR